MSDITSFEYTTSETIGIDLSKTEDNQINLFLDGGFSDYCFGTNLSKEDTDFLISALTYLRKEVFGDE